MKGMVKIYFGILKFQVRFFIGFLACRVATYDFSTIYTALPRNLTKEKLTELIIPTFNREGSLYLAFNEVKRLFTSEQPKR